ncbi:MAG: dihydrodipicolinate synthase family protein, partial [Vicinamibacterales bacterium]
EFIIGIKDSSGQAANVATFAHARDGANWTLLVGDDRLLGRGLQAGWDGGISGVAGFCPEVLVGLHQSFVAGRSDETARFQRLLNELIAQLAPFPTPWGIRIGLAARGIDTGPLPLPVTPARQQQIASFRDWLPAWLRRNGISTPDVRAARLTSR